MTRVVWPYELTVLDRDSWCYSATNPSNARFDIVRVLPSVVWGLAKAVAFLHDHLQCRGLSELQGGMIVPCY
eukprot:4182797-Amphidinium_carterae.1